MDPLSALSVACNILAIADAAVGTGKTIWELYNSTTGFTKETTRLIQATDQLQDALKALGPARTSLAASHPHDSNTDAAIKQCDKIILSIKAIVDECKVKEKGSTRSTTKAWFQSKVKHRSKLEDLQADLQIANDQLGMALAVATR
jgi:hypothetical protein